VLLFDEADAIFGKRSEVRDAHDRYANIEVAYLLQKMEDHDGVVILASNLPKNLDQAFARRMHYVVEFSRPGPALREQLWRGMFPPEVPLTGDIDYGFLAEQFELTGGDIQTIALEAAFLAAGEGSPVGMAQLMRAMARRQTKHGDPGVAARFRVHQDTLDRGRV
jgi:SpoVK/Ycf46/Vps4 family AAA+-type ATPase